jgi:FAD/FMN-containing dehydrogenase
VGGALAIDAHGTFVPAAGSLATGHTGGSLSNLVLRFTAIVWDPAAGAYVSKSFDRSHPDAPAFLM